MKITKLSNMGNNANMTFSVAAKIYCNFLPRYYKLRSSILRGKQISIYETRKFVLSLPFSSYVIKMSWIDEKYPLSDPYNNMFSYSISNINDFLVYKNGICCFNRHNTLDKLHEYYGEYANYNKCPTTIIVDPKNKKRRVRR